MALPDTLPPDALSANSKPEKILLPGYLKYAGPLLLLCLILGLLYQDGLVWLLKVWNGKAYSHGYLVPLVSLYLIWEQRERFRLLPTAPAYFMAAIVICASLALLLISRSSAFIQLEAASLFLIIPGVLLLLLGRQITRAVLLPWLYLSFTLPWFDLFLDRLQPPFQRLTAILGTKLLSLIYPVFLNDIHIQLPSITMEVAKECSGIGFFISVLAIGIPLVYLTQHSWNRAALVLSLGLLITILANGFRVAMAGIMGESFGPELLHGPAHIFQGWFVAWIGWAGLFLVNWLVVRTSDKNTPRLFERWESRPTSNEQKKQVTQISLRQLYFGNFTLALCAALIYFASPQEMPLSTPLVNFPLTLADWKGTEAAWLEKEAFFPGADEQLNRIYHSTQDTEPIYLHIAYFKKQTEPKRLISQFSRPLHKKAIKTVIQDTAPVTLPQKVNKTTLVQAGVPYDIFFWYQFPDGKTVTEPNQARLTALKNGIIHQQNNGAVILIAIQQNGMEKETTNDIPASITAFLKTVGPTVTGLLP